MELIMHATRNPYAKDRQLTIEVREIETGRDATGRQEMVLELAILEGQVAVSNHGTIKLFCDVEQLVDLRDELDKAIGDADDRELGRMVRDMVARKEDVGDVDKLVADEEKAGRLEPEVQADPNRAFRQTTPTPEPASATAPDF